MGTVYATDEKMLWICENCPIAASTIESINHFDINTAQLVTRYRVRFTDERETAWYLLKWEKCSTG